MQVSGQIIPLLILEIRRNFLKMVKAFNQFIGKTFRFKNIDLWGLNKSQELGALKFQVKESLVLY